MMCKSWISKVGAYITIDWGKKPLLSYGFNSHVLEIDASRYMFICYVQFLHLNANVCLEIQLMFLVVFFCIRVVVKMNCGLLRSLCVKCVRMGSNVLSWYMETQLINSLCKTWEDLVTRNILCVKILQWSIIVQI
jgi:hypothetical protein